ncbi:hypothetical protein ACFV6D_16865 [Kitasatospora sp. NPDC059812]
MRAQKIAQAVQLSGDASLARLRRMGVRVAEFTSGVCSWTRVLELLAV